MYIRYRAIDPQSQKEVLEMAEMIGISRSPKHHYIILSLSGNYMDVYFKMTEEEYEKMIDEICSSLENGSNVYTINFVGVMFDTSKYFCDSSNRLEKMDKIFEEMKFKK